MNVPKSSCSAIPTSASSGRCKELDGAFINKTAPRVEGFPEVEPTLNWVRLSQRFPVRIILAPNHSGRPFRMGQTAVVTIQGLSMRHALRETVQLRCGSQTGRNVAMLRPCGQCKLTPEMERFARKCVKSGRYNSVSEVIRLHCVCCKEQEEERRQFAAMLRETEEEAGRDERSPLKASSPKQRSLKTVTDDYGDPFARPA